MAAWQNGTKWRYRCDNGGTPTVVTSYIEIVDPPFAQWNSNPANKVPEVNGVPVTSCILAAFADIQNRARMGYVNHYTGTDATNAETAINAIVGAP